MKGLLLAKFTTTTKSRCTIIYPTREVLKEPNWNVAVLERQRLTQISSCGIDACCIRSKMTIGPPIRMPPRNIGRMEIHTLFHTPHTEVNLSDTTLPPWNICITHGFDQVQTLSCTDIPFSMFLDLRKYPRFYQCTSSQHDPVYTCFFNVRPIVVR